ncbi:unnamed protein product [Staurois parvus]|uniref:Core Histone H2A/H2B/H3 domain-containing protein n=1 Tax=Staurois parvus TaxID=386267 RepID=A0ABN9AUS1_9NEOB|nr:unnamed protein product [Staurois parvus]
MARSGGRLGRRVYAIYVYKVLKWVHPDTGISSKAMSIMDSFVNDFFDRQLPPPAQRKKKMTIILQWPPQPPDLHPTEHLWDVVEWEICIMDVQLTNLQQRLDTIMSIWTKIFEECFQHLVESIPHEE